MNTSLDTGCAGRDYGGCWFAKLITSGTRQRYAYCRKQLLSSILIFTKTAKRVTVVHCQQLGGGLGTKQQLSLKLSTHFQKKINNYKLFKSLEWFLVRAKTGRGYTYMFGKV
jgi:hypothetical protein